MTYQLHEVLISAFIQAVKLLNATKDVQYKVYICRNNFHRQQLLQIQRSKTQIYTIHSQSTNKKDYWATHFRRIERCISVINTRLI